MTAWKQRLLANSEERISWLRARSRGITATDAAKLTTEHSCLRVAEAKAYGSGFGGNPYTDHGKRREPVIAAWMEANYGISHSTGLYCAEPSQRHLATPDGIDVSCPEHQLVLAEIKTSNKPLEQMPKTYLRQIQWQQYVMGATKTLLIWEQHHNFVPDGPPRVRWIERDDRVINKLITLANHSLEILDELPEDPSLVRYTHAH